MQIQRSTRRNALTSALVVAAVGACSAPTAHAQGPFGGFAPQVTFPTGTGPRTVAMGDLDGNGSLDLAVSNKVSNNVSILINQTVVCSPLPDLNGDGFVNASDLATLLAQWGSVGSADLNCDGVVAAADLASLLANWGLFP